MMTTNYPTHLREVVDTIKSRSLQTAIVAVPIKAAIIEQHTAYDPNDPAVHQSQDRVGREVTNNPLYDAGRKVGRIADADRICHELAIKGASPPMASRISISSVGKA
ncbi:hypothetical protein [Rhizobium leguminosarum]